MVCNLLVVVTYIYCLFWKEDGDSEVTETTHANKPNNYSGDHTDLGTVPRTEVSQITFTEISGGTSSSWRSEQKQTTQTSETDSSIDASRNTAST
jgi:hypothetical protein